LLNRAEKDHVQAVGRVRALRLLKVLVAEVLFAMKCAAENNVRGVIKMDYDITISTVKRDAEN
jgi:hypothetical protein